MPGLTTLPEEVLDQVLGYLYDDLQSLMTCSLTCKKLLEPSRRRLFRGLALYQFVPSWAGEDSERTWPFHTGQPTLADVPLTVMSQVREIHIYAGRNILDRSEETTSAHMEHTLDALSEFTRFIYLACTVDDLWWPRILGKVLDCQAFAHITTLELNSSRFEKLSDLMQLLSAMPCLRTLYSFWTKWDIEPAGFTPMDSSTKLETLEITDSGGRAQEAELCKGLFNAFLSGREPTVALRTLCLDVEHLDGAHSILDKVFREVSHLGIFSVEIGMCTHFCLPTVFADSTWGFWGFVTADTPIVLPNMAKISSLAFHLHHASYLVSQPNVPTTPKGVHPAYLPGLKSITVLLTSDENAVIGPGAFPFSSYWDYLANWLCSTASTPLLSALTVDVEKTLYASDNNSASRSLWVKRVHNE